jgi:glycosyltransferase involved in cell wall biosynthesis
MLEEWTLSNPAPFCERAPHAVYVGGITEVRGVREMVNAVAEIEEIDGVCLLLIGTFYPERLEEEMRALPGWKQVDFGGWRTREELAEILAGARIGLVLLHPTAQYRDSIPTKLFEYMAAGLPVVASDFPLLRRLVDTLQCGLVVDPLDVPAIADAIQFLLDQPEVAEEMGKRGREAVQTRFNWKADSRNLLAVYDKLST